MDLALIKRKITQIEHAIKRVQSHLSKSLQDFQCDFDAQDIVYRNIQILVQNAVDIGSHLISTKNLPTPKSMGNVFDILATHRVINKKMGQELRKFVTLRNIIVHDYTRIDHKKVYRSLKKNLSLVSKFCLSILKNR